MSYENNPWLIPGDQIIANEDVIQTVSKRIIDYRDEPRDLHDWLKTSRTFLSTNQMREIRDRCNYINRWHSYEHALCSRVLDRWNLRKRFGVEGYYYHSQEYANTHESPEDRFTPFIAARLHPDWTK